MIQELVYTSAPRGLKAGSSGFCTVAATPAMAINLAQFLEGLSGYRHLHPPGTPEAKLNPVAHYFLRAKIGGRQFYVLSRLADAGLDYSGRSNKIAHHMVLDSPSVSAGPAWCLQHPSLMLQHWNGDPQTLNPRQLPTGRLEPAVCRTWQQLTGDAGWAGVLLDSFQSQRPINIVVPQGTDVLQLVLEAQALLPENDRWQATFATWFTRIPAGAECLWRFLPAGSPEVAIARRSRDQSFFDLQKPVGDLDPSAATASRLGKTFFGSAEAFRLDDEFDDVSADVRSDQLTTPSALADDVGDLDHEPRLAPPVPPRSFRARHPRSHNAFDDAGDGHLHTKRAALWFLVAACPILLVLGGLLWYLANSNRPEVVRNSNSQPIPNPVPAETQKALDDPIIPLSDNPELVSESNEPDELKKNSNNHPQPETDANNANTPVGSGDETVPVVKQLPVINHPYIGADEDFVANVFGSGHSLGKNPELVFRLPDVRQPESKIKVSFEQLQPAKMPNDYFEHVNFGTGKATKSAEWEWNVISRLRRPAEIDSKPYRFGEVEVSFEGTTAKCFLAIDRARRKEAWKDPEIEAHGKSALARTITIVTIGSDIYRCSFIPAKTRLCFGSMKTLYKHKFDFYGLKPSEISLVDLPARKLRRSNSENSGAYTWQCEIEDIELPADFNIKVAQKIADACRISGFDFEGTIDFAKNQFSLSNELNLEKEVTYTIHPKPTLKKLLLENTPNGFSYPENVVDGYYGFANSIRTKLEDLDDALREEPAKIHLERVKDAIKSICDDVKKENYYGTDTRKRVLQACFGSADVSEEISDRLDALSKLDSSGQPVAWPIIMYWADPDMPKIKSLGIVADFEVPEGMNEGICLYELEFEVPPIAKETQDQVSPPDNVQEVMPNTSIATESINENDQ